MTNSIIFTSSAQSAHDAWALAAPGTAIFWNTRYIGTKPSREECARIDALVKQICSNKE